MDEKQSRDRFLDITLIALALTVVFHFLPADHPFGIAFAIFVICLAGAMVLVAGLKEKPINRWAFVFLVPAVLSALADAIYASHVVQALAFLISLASLAFFAYWATKPEIPYHRIYEFWPFAFFKETIWPFGELTHYVSRIKGDRRLGGVLIGAIIALPFLVVFAALFASADQLFSHTFSSLFQDVNFGRYVFKTIRDVIVGVYFLAAGVMMLTRKSDTQAISHDSDAPAASTLSQTVYVTFLGLINILFLIFVGFQFAYFFGGETFLRAQGLTYADYARAGFFQLLFVAGVVFVITWAIYRMTGMRQTWTKILNVSLIVETGIIIISAIKRLSLYIGAYGLTLARWWAMFSIILIGLTLLAVAVFALLKISYSTASKAAFVGILVIASFALLVPTEGMIARYDIDRFLRGELSLDFVYLNDLTSDATTERVRLSQNAWPDDAHLYAFGYYGFSGPDARGSYMGYLKQSKKDLESYMSNVGLGTALSDHWALSALSSLP